MRILPSRRSWRAKTCMRYLPLGPSGTKYWRFCWPPALGDWGARATRVQARLFHTLARLGSESSSRAVACRSTLRRSLALSLERKVSKLIGSNSTGVGMGDLGAGRWAVRCTLREAVAGVTVALGARGLALPGGAAPRVGIVFRPMPAPAVRPTKAKIDRRLRRTPMRPRQPRRIGTGSTRLRDIVCRKSVAGQHIIVEPRAAPSGVRQ